VRRSLDVEYVCELIDGEATFESGNEVVDLIVSQPSMDLFVDSSLRLKPSRRDGFEDLVE
jgi:hypothetical protein